MYICKNKVLNGLSGKILIPDKIIINIMEYQNEPLKKVLKKKGK